ncbi:MAG: TIR domain-containing protein [Pseudobutyrivibrio sp.]|uniref:hypothetical protein n=1 Tax=Pseudobutyrivibrio sp. TaxID=2014367 RepID=UPI0025F556E9|nr:hypothetical protein [Pseudobutyrivibrio sp.]MBE5903285.1 TIR domain-containing protein [Pseudobutyrivibrio sp.]
MTKVNKFKSIIGEIDQLIKSNITSLSPEFQAWKVKVERFLISEYGGESYELKEFKKIRFSLSIYALGTPESEFVAACKRGLERAKAILSTYLDELEEFDVNEGEGDVKKVENLAKPLILLSHRSTDKKYGDAIERLLSSIGIDNNQLIYTSHPLHKIPLDKNIYEYLRESFGRKIFVIVLWSNEYLDSPACLNEMGAMWVTLSDYTNIYVPTFDFSNPKYYQCAVDKNKMGAVLDGSDNCKASMVELKNKIVDMFDLHIDESQWIFSLDQFMEDISD